MPSPTQRMCWSYLLETQHGVHDWDTDTFKLGLYDPSATLDPATTAAYTAAHEVSGVGYTAGGVVLSLATGFPKLSETGKVLWDFEDISLPTAAGFTTRYGLVYNFSKANRAVAVVDWGFGYSPVAGLLIVWPPPTDSESIMRLGA